MTVGVETDRRCSLSQRRSVWGVRGGVAGALLMAAIVTSGCYRYVPISAEAVAPKDEVRIRVTRDAAARLSRDLGTFSTELDGQFTREGPDSVSLGVTIDRQYRGTTVGTATQLLYLGRSEVIEVEKRELSRGRTVLVAAGTVVGFGLLAAGITQLVDPNGPPDDRTVQPPPPTLRRPAGRHFTVRISVP